MGRGNSYDKFLARLDATDAARARVRDERVAEREAVLVERRRVVEEFADRMSALGVPAVELPDRRLVRLPLTRRPRGSKPTRLGDMPRRIDKEVVEQPSGIRAWPTDAYLPAYRGTQAIHQPVYVTTDARLVAENRQERIADGPAVHQGRQVHTFSPGWRFVEPPEQVAVRRHQDGADGADGAVDEWAVVPFGEHLRQVMRAAAEATGRAESEGAEGEE